MKKYLVLFLFTLITTVSLGQNNYQDVVYLKNGNIIRGTIIEQIPNKSIKIKTPNKSIYFYQMDEIEKITKEPLQVRDKSKGNKSDLQSGYQGIVEYGFQIGQGIGIKLNIINGYKINSYFSLGFGTGLRDYRAALIPMFIDFRANFTENDVLPYISLDVGHSFIAIRYNDIIRGGFFLNPTIGVSFKNFENFVLNAGIEYEIQRMTILYRYYYDDVTKNSGAIGIKVGISF